MDAPPWGDTQRRSCAIPPNGTVGAVPMCPPERPRSGVSIPKIHALCAGMNDGCALTGRLGRAHRHRPYQTLLYIHAQSPQRHQPPLPISTKPRGAPLPHRGYTFDSAGLASAKQPTLGNDVRDVATPLGVVLFLIAHHYHTRRMDYSRMISPHEN